MANLHHICVTEFEIDQTPSRLAGIDVETETRLRSFGCELIDDIGFLLNLYGICPWNHIACVYSYQLKLTLVVQRSNQASGSHFNCSNTISSFLLRSPLHRSSCRSTLHSRCPIHALNTPIEPSS